MQIIIKIKARATKSHFVVTYLYFILYKILTRAYYIFTNSKNNGSHDHP